MRRLVSLALGTLLLAAFAGSQEGPRLTRQEEARIREELSRRKCDCGCGLTVAACLRDDPTCERSRAIAEDVIRVVVGARGASRQRADPDQLAGQPPESDHGQWYEAVAGRQLVYIHTSASYREKRCLWLYEDGTFDSSLQGGSVSSLGSAAFGDGGGQGTWRVHKNVLTLVGPEGDTARYEMSFRDDFLYLDGDRYFRVDLDDETCG